MNYDIRQPVMGSRLQTLKEEIHRWAQRPTDFSPEVKERLAWELTVACDRLQAFLWILVGENLPEVRTKLNAYQKAVEELALPHIPQESDDANT